MSAHDKRPDLAERFIAKALANARSHQAGAPDVQRFTYNAVGNYLLEAKRPAEALPVIVEAARIAEGIPSISPRILAIEYDNLGVAQAAVGDYSSAAGSTAKALQILERTEQTPAVRGTRGVILYNVAYRLSAQGRTAEAEVAFRESLELISTGPERWRLEIVADEFGKLLTKLGRAAEVEELSRRYK